MQSFLKRRFVWLCCLIVLALVAVPLITQAQAAPTISSDKDDYAPGELVTLTGTGWQPGETVHIFVDDDTGKTWNHNVDVMTAGDGTLTYQFQLPNWFVATYTVTATGAASGTATTTFTDGNASSVSGQVTDTNTGLPISGATVSCTSGCNGSSNTTTDASGNYFFDGAPGHGAKLTFVGNGPANLTLTASMSGYTNATQTLTGVNNGNSFQNINFSLTPTCTGPSISTPPSGAITTVGEPVSFSVTVGGTAPLSYQWHKNGGNVGTNSSSYSIASVLTSDAGSYDVVVSNACGSATSSAATLIVNKATPVITWSNAADIEYGMALGSSQLNATASVPGAFIYTPAAGAILSVGASQTLHVDFMPTDTANYNNASKDVTINVTKHPIQVTADAKSKIYGDADPALTYQITSGSLVGGDSFSGALSRVAGENVGSYAIQQDTLALNSNYNLTFVGANLTITPKAASVTPNAASKTYGDADPVLSGTLSGFLAGDGVTASYSRTAGETVAGSPYSISASLVSVGALGNYDITYNTAEFTITPKALVASITANDKVYDGTTTASFNCSLSGVISGDDVICSGGTAAFADKNVGSWTVTATGLGLNGADAGNYTVNATATDTAEITPKAASVTPNAASKTYGDADPVLSGTLSGFLAGDGVTASYSRTAGETVAGSPYSISASLIPAGVLGNYDITYNTAEFTITPKAASVTPNNNSKILGAVDPDPLTTGTLTGFLAGDGVTASYSRTAGESVGAYAISAALSPANVLSNYIITYNTATFSIVYSTGTCFGAPGHTILQPINADGSSVFKQKSTVPAKFRVCDANGNSIGTPGVVRDFKLFKTVAGTVESSANEAVESTTPDTAFRWSTSDQQWIFNINTKNLSANKTYFYRITLNDGSTIEFSFGLK